MKQLLLLVILAILTTSLSAEITLPKVLSNNMVLQQNSNINLWGSAKENTTVTIKASWLKTTIHTQSDGMGNWFIKLKTPAGSFQPQNITISDGKIMQLSNILIGEVWVCSGQSNMEMPVRGFNNQPVKGSFDFITNAGKEINNIRLFTVEKARSFKEKTDCKGGTWQETNCDAVANFSAVAYFFAYNLTHAINVPVGVIASDWGGTKIESWMPLETLKSCVSESQYEQKNKTNGIKPSELYGAMIAPLKYYTAKGFIWYQGESNLADTDHYDKMMAAMVNRWRHDWGDSKNNMPFYYVQIAPFVYDGDSLITYPLFVETQNRALKLIANSGMAATTDIGDAKWIHPTEKFKVGQRLAALALSDCYGQNGFDPNAPALVSAENTKEGKIKVQLSHASSGLYPWYQEPIVGFEISGKDKIFYPAKAVLDESKPGCVIVWNDSIKNPVAVRYAFRNVIKGNLRNMSSIPAIPFRSDTWNDIK